MFRILYASLFPIIIVNRAQIYRLQILLLVWYITSSYMHLYQMQI